ncbi:unnamed protein product [Amoebophrya sp. A120]|nr:unnamed protein product [Amoebophrya sp. A120]|eukprot:GSA120T00010702001.1
MTSGKGEKFRFPGEESGNSSSSSTARLGVVPRDEQTRARPVGQQSTTTPPVFSFPDEAPPEESTENSSAQTVNNTSMFAFPGDVARGEAARARGAPRPEGERQVQQQSRPVVVEAGQDPDPFDNESSQAVLKSRTSKPLQMDFQFPDDVAAATPSDVAGPRTPREDVADEVRKNGTAAAGTTGTVVPGLQLGEIRRGQNQEEKKVKEVITSASKSRSSRGPSSGGTQSGAPGGKNGKALDTESSFAAQAGRRRSGIYSGAGNKGNEDERLWSRGAGEATDIGQPPPPKKMDPGSRVEGCDPGAEPRDDSTTKLRATTRAVVGRREMFNFGYTTDPAPEEESLFWCFDREDEDEDAKSPADLEAENQAAAKLERPILCRNDDTEFGFWGCEKTRPIPQCNCTALFCGPCIICNYEGCTLKSYVSWALGVVFGAWILVGLYACMCYKPPILGKHYFRTTPAVIGAPKKLRVYPRRTPREARIGTLPEYGALQRAKAVS